MSRGKLKTAEMYCGTKSFSKVMAMHGHSTYTVDNDKQFEPDLREDVFRLFDNHFGRIVDVPDILWASPPCQPFSTGSMGHHWGGGRRAYIPKTEAAKTGVRLVKKTIKMIETSKPRYWFIENPRGVLRNLPFMDEFLKRAGGVRHTIWYCRYGSKCAKPTDIWTNALWWTPRPICHNRRPDHPRKCGCRDHDAAPRGAKTGTQGKDGATERGRIPESLFHEILAQLPR